MLSMPLEGCETCNPMDRPQCSSAANLQLAHFVLVLVICRHADGSSAKEQMPELLSIFLNCFAYYITMKGSIPTEMSKAWSTQRHEYTGSLQTLKLL